jgi:hypothetical protein
MHFRGGGDLVRRFLVDKGTIEEFAGDRVSKPNQRFWCFKTVPNRVAMVGVPCGLSEGSRCRLPQHAGKKPRKRGRRVQKRDMEKEEAVGAAASSVEVRVTEILKLN